MSECVNLTGHGDHDSGGDLDTKLSSVINQWLIPGTCAFGVVGNLLNLAILRRRQLQKSFRTLEQGANFCLVYLALSDLMVCIFALLTFLLPADNIFEHTGISLTYKLYNTAIINTFIMESTMLTVAMSLERYLAICFPLRLDIYLTTRRIKFVVLFTFIFSICFNIPVFWRFEDAVVCADYLEDHVLNSTNVPGFSNTTNAEVNSEFTKDSIALQNATNNVFKALKAWTTRNSTNFWENNTILFSTPSLPSISSLIMKHPNSTVSSSFLSTTLSTPESSSVKINLIKPKGKTKYTTRILLLGGNYASDTAYRILWAFFGNIVPLALLVYFNMSLCRQIYNSYQQQRQLGRQKRTRNPSNSLTLTLVAIVVLFFILVAPSEITLLVFHVFGSDSNPTSKTIEAVLNLMQSINFSVNFILYCIINPYFRKTLKHMVMCGCCWLSDNTRQWSMKLQTSLM